LRAHTNFGANFSTQTPKLESAQHEIKCCALAKKTAVLEISVTLLNALDSTKPGTGEKQDAERIFVSGIFQTPETKMTMQ